MPLILLKSADPLTVIDVFKFEGPRPQPSSLIGHRVAEESDEGEDLETSAGRLGNSTMNFV